MFVEFRQQSASAPEERYIVCRSAGAKNSFAIGSTNMSLLSER